MDRYIASSQVKELKEMKYIKKVGCDTFFILKMSSSSWSAPSSPPSVGKTEAANGQKVYSPKGPRTQRQTALDVPDSPPPKSKSPQPYIVKEPDSSVDPQGKVYEEIIEPKAAAQEPPPKKRAPTLIHVMEKEFADIIRKGLRPMADFVASVAVATGKSARSILKWKGENKSFDELVNSIVVTGAESEDEFVANNIHFGPDILEMFFRMRELRAKIEETKKTEETEKLKLNGSNLIGSCFPGFDVPLVYHYRPIIQRLIPVIPEEIFAPNWVFGVLPDVVFRELVSEVGIAAFELALSHVQTVQPTFELKELICSSQTARIFTMFVAYQNLKLSAVGSVRKAWGDNRGNTGRSIDIVGNAKQAQMWAEKIECGLIWFKSVYKRPSKEYEKWTTEYLPKYAAHLAEVTALRGGRESYERHQARITQAKYVEETAKLIGKNLPKYELVHIE